MAESLKNQLGVKVFRARTRLQRKQQLFPQLRHKLMILRRGGPDTADNVDCAAATKPKPVKNRSVRLVRRRFAT